MVRRVGGALDVQRLGAAIRGPGVDTRTWISLAIATSDSTVDLAQGREGVFVDVRLMPSEEALTARVGPVYAGSGFGFYANIRVNDELLVAIPSGDPANGVVVVNRLWSAADPPPIETQTYPEDLILVVEEEGNLRIVIQQGGGKAYIDVQDSDGNATNQLVVGPDLIELGAEGALDKASLDSKVQTEFGRVQSEHDSRSDVNAKHRHPQEMHWMPLIPNPAQPIAENIQAPLTYFPPGQPPLNAITTAEATPANAPMDTDAQAGRFVLPKIPPTPGRESGLFPDGEDPGDTASERVTIDK